MSMGAWEPLWLDAEGRCLYAALHRPPTATQAPGVLFVPPLLHEQPRGRRFIAEVASGLAALGLPCLRFDFFGTADSCGTEDQVDFASMRMDLDLAAAALRSHTGVKQVVLLAWRGAALPAHTWLSGGNRADLLVLWEPITDGAQWLTQLESEDASERQIRPRLRPGVRSTASVDDGQLMGCAVSPSFRRDLAQARLGNDPPAHRIPTWAVVRPAMPPLSPPLPIDLARVLRLPAEAPTFAGSARMDATLFLSPPLEKVVNELGRILLEPQCRAVLEPQCR